MSVPELLYGISSPEEAFQDSLRRVNILIDELRFKDSLRRVNILIDEMRSTFTKSIEELRSYPNKVTSQKIVLSAGIAPDIDHLQVINQVLSKPSISNPQTSRLQTQTRFITPLSCDLELDITKPTSRKIVVSAETKPSKSDPSSSLKPTHLTKLAHFHQLMALPWKIVTTAGLDGVAQDNPWQ